MEGHQRNLYLYERFNAQVLGASRDDASTLQYWAKDLGLTFPLLSNVTGFFGEWAGVQVGAQPVFGRRTIVADRSGRVRYAADGSPDYWAILRTLKAIEEEESSR